MGQKVPPGLVKRGGVWHVQKTISGKRVRESTGTGDLTEAERYLAYRMEETRKTEVYGVRQKRTFREGATRYLNEATKSTLCEDKRQLKYLDPYIGDLPLEAVHMGTLQSFIAERKHLGIRKKDSEPKMIHKRTINCALQTVRRILNLAASEWLDERGETWLAHAPKIKLLQEDDKKEPYPLSWQEQGKLFQELPPYLAKMALFKVNTGTRDQEVCNLLWEWECSIPELGTSVFIIPAHAVKNKTDRLVVLNRLARAVVQEMRGQHPTHVFSHKGKPLYSMYGTVWKNARESRTTGCPRS